MRELSAIRNEQDGQIVDDPGKTPTQRKEKAEKDYIDKVFGSSSLASSYIDAEPNEKEKIVKDAMKIIVQIFGDPLINRKRVSPTLYYKIFVNICMEKMEKRK